MHNMPYDAEIGVLGSGVIGASIGLRLADRERDVLLFDAGDPAKKASVGNAGHIAIEQTEPLASPASWLNLFENVFSYHAPVSFRLNYLMQIAPWVARFALASLPPYFAKGNAALPALMKQAMTAFEDTIDVAGAGALFNKQGHFIAAEEYRASSKHEKMVRHLKNDGIEARVASEQEVGELSASLGRTLAGAIKFEETANIYDPEKVTRTILDAALSRNAFLVKANIISVYADQYGFVLRGESGDQWRVKKLVVAAGAWSHNFTRQLGEPVPLETERGYHLQVRNYPSYKDDIGVPVICQERNMIVSPIGGGVRASGFVEFGGLKNKPTKSLIQKLHENFDLFMPSVSHLEREEWMGFRPTLPDYLPIISPSKRHEGAFYAFGHQHLGVTLSGITAQLVESMILENKVPELAKPFRIDRF